MDSYARTSITEIPRFSIPRVLIVLLLFLASLLVAFISGGITSHEEVSAELISSEATKDITVVDFLDVGQGASTLIRFSDGKVLLADTGPKSARERLLGYLEARDIGKIDCFVLTHQHGDHTDNTVAVLDEYEVSNLFIPDAPSSLFLSIPKYEDLYREIHERGYALQNPIKNEVLLTGDNYTVTVLSDDSRQYSQLNDYSIVLKIEIGDICFLLMADAEETIERQLLEEHDMYCDVLQVGHHGNYAGTSESLLQEAHPNIAIISVGTNTFGQPSDSALDRLERNGCAVFRTDLFRTVTVSTDGERMFLNYGEI